MDRWLRQFPLRGAILLAMPVCVGLLGLAWEQRNPGRADLSNSNGGAFRGPPGSIHGGSETPRLLPVPSEALVSPPLHERGPQSPEARPPRCRTGPSATPPLDFSDEKPPALLRPLASLAGRRSWTIELAARQADMHTQQGLELTDRGACFSARREFLRALEVVAETLDSDRRTAEHARALAEGLQALDEARNAPPDVSRNGTGRRPPTYAEERLAASAGEELAGSMALYALGRLHAALARHSPDTMPWAGAWAETFYRASLRVCPRNYMAAARPAGGLPFVRWVHPEEFAGRSHAADPWARRGAEERARDWSGLGGWEAARAVFWQAYVEGQAAGRARIPYPPENHLRAGDLLELTDRSGGAGQRVRVSADGTIALPAVGPTPAEGLTPAELQREIHERFREDGRSVEMTAVLVERAPASFLVLGEVCNPGRFELKAPTTLVQAIRLAGGWKSEATGRQIAVFRRDRGSRLAATMVNLSAPLADRRPDPCGEIPLAGGDVVVAPGADVLSADELAERVFAGRAFGALPLGIRAPLGRLGTF